MATNGLGSLLTELNSRLSKSDLKNICFDLGVDYENLSGGTKLDKVRELLLHLERTNTLGNLLVVGPRIRTDIAWSELVGDVISRVSENPTEQPAVKSSSQYPTQQDEPLATTAEVSEKSEVRLCTLQVKCAGYWSRPGTLSILINNNEVSEIPGGKVGMVSLPAGNYVIQTIYAYQYEEMKQEGPSTNQPYKTGRILTETRQSEIIPFSITPKSAVVFACRYYDGGLFTRRKITLKRET